MGFFTRSTTFLINRNTVRTLPGVLNLGFYLPGQSSSVKDIVSSTAILGFGFGQNICLARCYLHLNLKCSSLLNKPNATSYGLTLILWYRQNLHFPEWIM